jgi:serine protease Do
VTIAAANNRMRKSTQIVAFSLACLLLAGCASSTRIAKNANLSEELKAKDYASYKEILFVPPKTDPQEVVPNVVAGLEGMGFKVTLVTPDKPLDASQGTGFVIANGYLLTCAHVIGEEKTATVTLAANRYIADVVKRDKLTDLALLKLQEPMPTSIAPLSFRAPSIPYNMGEDVFTIGYPLSRLLGDGARMTKGLLSATTGLRDDAKSVQVSAEVQPGNSGGPLLNQRGQIIGIVQQTVNPWRVAQASGGALPQNINFAEKNEPILGFLKDVDGLPALTFDQGNGLDHAAGAVAKIQAGTLLQVSDPKSKLIVHFNYVAFWDMWWRFRYFALTAYDYDAQEALFAVGQTYDNPASNETTVIRDTLAKFKTALQNH